MLDFEIGHPFIKIEERGWFQHYEVVGIVRKNTKKRGKGKKVVYLHFLNAEKPITLFYKHS